MPRNRIQTVATSLTVGAIILGGFASSGSADERVTIGGFVGAHIFSDTIELGKSITSTSEMP